MLPTPNTSPAKSNIFLIQIKYFVKQKMQLLNIKVK